MVSQIEIDTNLILQAFHAVVSAGSKMKSEDFNKYSLILDVDGNGWSDRFRYGGFCGKVGIALSILL